MSHLKKVFGTPIWEDIRVPVTATRKEGSKQPGFGQFKDDGSSSQGVFIDWFDKSTEEELYFAMQMPHSYKFGTDLHAHVHWVPETTGGANELVRWGMEYTFQEINSVFGNTTLIYSSAVAGGDTTMVAGKHYLTELGEIDGSAIDSVSSMLIGRIFRDATHADDDYDDDAGLLEIDFHYQKDTDGSRQEYVK